MSNEHSSIEAHETPVISEPPPEILDSGDAPGSEAGAVAPQNEELPLLAVRDTVVFPGALLPITVGRPASVALVQALGENRLLASSRSSTRAPMRPDPKTSTGWARFA